MNLPSRIFVFHHRRQIASFEVCDLTFVTCHVNFFAKSLPVAVRVDKNVACLSSLLAYMEGRTYVRHGYKTQFSRIDGLPYFLNYGAPRALLKSPFNSEVILSKTRTLGGLKEILAERARKPHTQF